MKKSIYISIFLLLLFVLGYFFVIPYFSYKNPGNVDEPKKSSFSFIENGLIQGLADAVNSVFNENGATSTHENSTQEDTSDDNYTDKNEDIEDEDSDNAETSPKKSDLDLLKEKTSLIENYVYTLGHPDETKDYESTISNIFVSSLVEFYGEEELKKTLNFENIKFSNYLLINDNEASATAEITLNGTTSTFKAYFYKQNSDWYLYKTQ